MADLEQKLAASYRLHISAMRARHDLALQKAGADWVAIPSGSVREAFLDDRAYEFIPNPHFKSWLPLTSHPDCCIVYRRGRTPKLIYLQPRDFWHMAPKAPAGFWADHFDIAIVESESKIGTELPQDKAKGIAIGELDGGTDYFGIDRINPAAAIHSLHNARTRKTAYELECMREAQRLAVAGHSAAERAFRDGRSEYDIHMAYCEAMMQRESELPYNNIIALNEHSAVLHYQFLDRHPPRKIHSFLIDAGAQFNGYAADITRTYSSSDPSFENLINAVDRLQNSLVAMVKAGVDYRSLHLLCHRLVARLLIDSDICTGSADELIERDISKIFYPHGLGHFLGLQVHDVAGLVSGDDALPRVRPQGHDSLRLTRDLEADAVVTIEPGIYFIPMLLDPLRGQHEGRLINWTRIDMLMPFGGIRIEDDVRVLAEGCENLTRDAFAAA